MNVSRTVAIPLDDLYQIQKRIEKDEFKNISEFIRIAVKNELKR